MILTINAPGNRNRYFGNGPYGVEEKEMGVVAMLGDADGTADVYGLIGVPHGTFTVYKNFDGTVNSAEVEFFANQDDWENREEIEMMFDSGEFSIEA